MREIKFRAWDKRSLKWFDMSTFELHSDCIVVRIPGMSNFAIIKEDYELMQYTGMKDKNGVPVFEGDIYTFTFDNGHKNQYTVDSLQDFFENKGLYEGEYGWDYSEIEVIGNIYSNPELLKRHL